jgi:hypothetical protein
MTEMKSHCHPRGEEWLHYTVDQSGLNQDGHRVFFVVEKTLKNARPSIHRSGGGEESQHCRNEFR